MEGVTSIVTPHLKTDREYVRLAELWCELRSRWIYLALIAFATILLASAAIVVHGSLRPAPLQMIAIGDYVPAFSLPSIDGRICQVNPTPGGQLLLIAAPANSPSELLSTEVRDLMLLFAADARTLTVGIVCSPIREAHRFPVKPCDMLLIDENHTLWQLTGNDNSSASICMVGADGRLKTRRIISDLQPAAQASVFSPEPLPNAQGATASR